MLCVVVLRRAHSTQRRNNRKQQFPCAVTAAGVSPMPETATFGKKKKKENIAFFPLLSPFPRPPSCTAKNRLEPKKNIVHRSTAGLSPSITTTTITTTTTLPPTITTTTTTTTTTTNHQPPTDQSTGCCDPPSSTLRLSFRGTAAHIESITKNKICHLILSIGASLHLTTIDCLPDCSSFRDRRFYSATTTSITATATSTTTATATTRRHHLGTCVIRNNN
ncbi:PREDICTED: salivary glue protein Sgs-3-like [Acromyrmex echinatior]|uniref:salivary glue protein Sgs-3-like n=1 Tax=Acromyrmex echinatior TaxID=103372 RepID=UPI000580D6D5|nr:PREDICTED: salivary glue protein Sgs-3-like [Acromyrmex echinatior]